MISIIVPFYNRKELLKQSIESVLIQDIDFELILIDDGSTDGALELAKDYAIKDSRVKVFKRDIKPKGAPTCRNLGLHYAKMDYVMFLDSDDLLLPYSLKLRLSQIKRSDEDLLIFDVRKVPTEEVNTVLNHPETIKNYPRWSEYKFTNLQTALILFLSHQSPWQTAGALWRRQWLLNNKIYFDPKLKLWQDVDFHINALLKSPKFKNLIDIAPADVIYRVHSQTISQRGYPLSYRKSQIYFFKKWLNLLPAGLKSVLYKRYVEFKKIRLKKASKQELLYYMFGLHKLTVAERLEFGKRFFNFLFQLRQ